MSVYYYLLSGLKEFHLNDSNKTIDLVSICDHVLEQLDEKDGFLFKYLIYPNDNKNLSYIMASNLNMYSSYDEYIKPSVFDGTALEHPNTVSSEFPLYMQDFLDNNKNVDWASIAHIENNLLSAFYNEVLASDNKFLSEYFSFLIDLKNIIAAINLRMLGYSNDKIKKSLIGDSMLVDMIAKSAADDFGVSKEYPYIASMLNAIKAKDPYALEKVEMDTVFEYIEVKSSSMFFQLENVFVYYIKCLYIDRLSNRDAEEGKEAIKTLISEIKKSLDNVKV